MRYELLLQSSVPGAPYDALKVHQALATRGVTVSPEGKGAWTLKAGALELAPLIDGGRQVATEVRIPLSGNPDLVREAVFAAAAVADEAGVRLYDPQLSKAVGALDVEAVVGQYAKTATYAADTMGDSEAFLSVSATVSESQKKGWKIVLGVVAVLVFLYLLSESAISRM